MDVRPSAWVGLATLVVLEIVLGIDNLVFIAIWQRNYHHQRNAARRIGLVLALLMRLVLLASIAWVVTLTEPLFHILTMLFRSRPHPVVRWCVPLVQGNHGTA